MTHHHLIQALRCGVVALLALACLAACSLFPRQGRAPEPVIYTAACFKTWLLGEEWPFYYTPNRLRQPHPATGSLWHGIVKEKGPAEDINVFAERLDMERLAALCYQGRGSIWFVPGERVPIDRGGLLAGLAVFRAYQPARFVTGSGLDLSVIASNVFLLWQLYLDDAILPIVGKDGKWWFRWSHQADAMSFSGQPGGLRLNAPGLAAAYPVLAHLDRAYPGQPLPAIPCRLRETEEVVLDTRDELRGDEGTYSGLHRDFEFAHAAYEGAVGSLTPMTAQPAKPGKLWPEATPKPRPATETKPSPQDLAFTACIHRAVGEAPRHVRRAELWMPARRFPNMERDPQYGAASSVIRYEYFSCFAPLADYYAGLPDEHARERRRPQRIYHR